MFYLSCKFYKAKDIFCCITPCIFRPQSFGSVQSWIYSGFYFSVYLCMSSLLSLCKLLSICPLIWMYFECLRIKNPCFGFQVTPANATIRISFQYFSLKKKKKNSTPCWEEGVKTRSFGERGNNFTRSEIPILQLEMQGMWSSHSFLSHSEVMPKSFWSHS